MASLMAPEKVQVGSMVSTKKSFCSFDCPDPDSRFLGNDADASEDPADETKFALKG